MTAKAGDTIRVRITGRVGAQYDRPDDRPDLLATTRVYETRGDGEGFYHNLFLLSESVTQTGDSVGAEFDESVTQTGDSVGAEFDAVVSDERIGSVTRVSETGNGSNHFVYLGSPAVTVLSSPAVTVLGEEAASTPTYDSENMVGARFEPGITVGSAFTFGSAGVITGDQITVVPDPALTDAYMAARTGPGDEDRRITIDAREISSQEVLSRISELQAKTPSGISAVVRRKPRPGQERVIAQFSEFSSAVQFIDDEDYDKARIGVEINRVRSGDDDAELEKLQQLDGSGRVVFGSRRWGAGGVRLYRSDFFDENWARAQAAEELKVSTEDLDVWPLSMVAWDLAARTRRDSDCEFVYFDGKPYWGFNE